MESTVKQSIVQTNQMGMSSIKVKDFPILWGSFITEKWTESTMMLLCVTQMCVSHTHTHTVMTLNRHLKSVTFITYTFCYRHTRGLTPDLIPIGTISPSELNLWVKFSPRGQSLIWRKIKHHFLLFWRMKIFHQNDF